MRPASVEVILNMLGPDDVVLDIGGWACPFNRANYILDAEPYETRGYYRLRGLPGSQGGDNEQFTEQTWIRRDICDKAPYPFRDKEIDFVICSHTLEDVRDPLWVCSEMIRVAKRGYIEVPSRLAETCRGWESPHMAGLSHHRWLIDIDESAKSIEFLMKYHMIHSATERSFPPSFFRSLDEDQRVSWLFWDGSFTFSETTIHSLDALASELEGYVARTQPYPAWRLRLAGAARRMDQLVRSVGRRLSG